MSEADKFFEKLGYKLSKTKRNAIVFYNKEFKESIVFDLEYKTVSCETENGYALPITLKELQTIIMKIKELGWEDFIYA